MVVGLKGRGNPETRFRVGVSLGGEEARHAAFGSTSLTARALELAGVDIWQLAQEEQTVRAHVDPGLCPIRGHEALLERCQTVQPLP